MSTWALSGRTLGHWALDVFRFRARGDWGQSPLPIRDLLLRFRNIWRKILFTPTHRGHKANPVSLRNDTSPALLIDITPAGKFPDRSGLGISLRWKKKKLHSFFDHPNLGDATGVFVIENTATN